MITLIHGDDIEASRAEFMRLKGNASVLDGKLLDATQLAQSAASLFGEEIYIERLLSKQPKLVLHVPSDAVLWEDKEISAAVIKKLSNPTVKLFKLPVLLFQFLDTFSLALYQKLDNPELVHFMLAKRVRQLIQIRDGVVPEGLQGWQASRLTRQAKVFTMERLLSMYKKLLEIEFSVKNGSSPFTLSELTEQFLLEL